MISVGFPRKGERARSPPQPLQQCHAQNPQRDTTNRPKASELPGDPEPSCGMVALEWQKDGLIPWDHGCGKGRRMAVPSVSGPWELWGWQGRPGVPWVQDMWLILPSAPGWSPPRLPAILSSFLRDRFSGRDQLESRAWQGAASSPPAYSMCFVIPCF